MHELSDNKKPNQVKIYVQVKLFMVIFQFMYSLAFHFYLKLFKPSQVNVEEVIELYASIRIFFITNSTGFDMPCTQI
jgi:hypothetical protein